jgi:transcriptional regulator with XRE-family HTH domain
MDLSTPIQRMALDTRVSQSGWVLAETISKNIQRVREAKGVSRSQLGLRMNPPTSSQQIERLEKGERRLTVEWIERIAKGLGVDPAELIAGEPQRFTMTPEVADEVALELGRIVLQGGEPSPEIVTNLSLVLQALSETFARHPTARRDPEVARPVIDLLAHRFARQS